jgi:hypothetical protein
MGSLEHKNLLCRGRIILNAIKQRQRNISNDHETKGQN